MKLITGRWEEATRWGGSGAGRTFSNPVKVVESDVMSSLSSSRTTDHGMVANSGCMDGRSDAASTGLVRTNPISWAACAPSGRVLNGAGNGPVLLTYLSAIFYAVNHVRVYAGLVRRIIRLG